ncbi:hypothetical protein BDM02DRAFT_3184676 [Thelephora ganbajun]|uniref:Uncharacterized protein n=1 Tax=Thelephora ganbajun TaxID=370292 RepID=A0ACB6ZPD0_THEGA|nr:hypothetical protein BDM02DRAFT_3184676 [Thelephora ganbajun]
MSILSSQTRSLPPRVLSFTTSLWRHKHDTSASAKLFEDAERERQEERLQTERREQTMDALLTRQAGRNWDGDEPIADAVLRMLVDKYKPLRSGTIITADEKLSKSTPTVRMGSIHSISSLSPSESIPEGVFITSDRSLTYPKIDPSKSLKDQPLLPAVEGHRPWHTNFTEPSHATASMRIGNFNSVKSGPSLVLDEKARKLEKENKRRFQTVFKLERAKESVLDHRLGIRRQQQKRTQANPIAMEGWRSLVEARIENARIQGRFDNVKGRGKPMAANDDEKNPFIGREEFLMNQMESAVASFRQVLRQAWSRRVFLVLVTAAPPPQLDRLTVDYIKNLRDPEWEEREYNATAPYIARRVLYTRSIELERLYKESAKEIHEQPVAKLSGNGSETTLGSGRNDEDSDFVEAHGVSLPSLSVREMVKELFTWRRPAGASR